MIEDKLTHDERVRLEALSQAVNTFAQNVGKVFSPSADNIIRIASKYEKFIKEGVDD